jgi:hypothetical protein
MSTGISSNFFKNRTVSPAIIKMRQKKSQHYDRCHLDRIFFPLFVQREQAKLRYQYYYLIFGMHRMLLLPDIWPAGYPAIPTDGYLA